MWNVYILRSNKDLKFYIGCTNNLVRRIAEHNSGQVVSTRNRQPMFLVYREEFLIQTDAYAREKKLKSYKSGNALKKLIHS